MLRCAQHDRPRRHLAVSGACHAERSEASLSRCDDSFTPLHILIPFLSQEKHLMYTTILYTCSKSINHALLHLGR